MKTWLLAARPKTLSAAIVPVLMGTALALRPIRWDLFFFALAGSLCIQIGTNLVNDALDFRRGADRPDRLGPVRVTQAGLIRPEVVLRGAYLSFALALACGVPLLLRGGWPMLVIGVSSIAAAYLYTGGPYPLAYNGLGELFVMIFFGFIAVGGSYYVQTLTMNATVLVTGLVAGSLATTLLVINNLRDVESDRLSNKRTMAVRLGESFSRYEIAFFALIPFFAEMFIAQFRHDDWMLLPLAAALLAFALIRRVFGASGRELNRCLAMAGALQWLFGILFVAGTFIH